MADRYGTPLLALTTLRPADKDRGDGIVHLVLDLPGVVADEVRAWELGQRPFLPGYEAAQLLWTLPVGTFLDGRLAAWREIPGVAPLDAGLAALAALDRADWPSDRNALRDLVVQAAGFKTWESLAQLLTKVDVLGALNDLVLLFKYAAVHRARPIARIVDLYRLARALFADPGPDCADAVAAWLAAPLVVPGVFTEGSGLRGPAPPQQPPSSHPEPPAIDPTAPATAAALARLEAELDAGFSKSITPRSRGVVRAYLFGSPVLIDTTHMVNRVGVERRRLAAALTRTLPEGLRERLAESGRRLEDLPSWDDLLPLVQPTPSYLKPSGRSDLLLVRQQTTGYRRAEIGHVENILIGEERNRQHVDRTLTRTEIVETVERESEVTRDLQNTDRAELSREVSKVVEEDLHLEGNVQVTSRGPTKIVASAGVAVDRSTEEAASTAERYSRETIERAVKRTLERVTREMRTLFEREVTETNTHGFHRESTETDHVSGVYQFLERVSHAKIFWYGERELYDVIIPEPAALIWQLAITRPEVQIPVEEPDHELFASLTLDNIGDKLEDVIRSFRVTDIPPQPAPARTATFTFSATGSGDSAHHATSKDVQLPDGYEVTDATFVVTAEVEDEEDTPNGGVAVGNEVQIWTIALSQNQGQTSRFFNFANPLPGPTVAVAFNADNFTSIAGSITLNLSLVNSARRDWAATALGRVAERYEQLRREYAQAVIQAAANRPAETITLPDGARSALQGIVRAEIQRNVVDVMRNSPVDYNMINSFPYSNPDGTLGSQPVIDYARRADEVPEVQFLQQAFEWEHASWILYPYFWGRRSEWGRMVVTGHPDPDFLAFLNAGAARVQVPARPGFEDLIRHYMETGEVYAGNELPKMGDPGYVTFIDEQLTSLGAPGEEVAWPPGNVREWDIVAPTSLVMVRSTALSALPAWDPDSGEET